MATKVVLDANALLVPFETGIRLEAELARLLGSYTAVVPESVLKELAAVAATAKGQRAANARLALQLSRRFEYRPTRGRGDEGVLEAARAEAAHLLTNDRDLIRRALALGTPVIRIKGRSHLIVETGQGEVR